MLNIFQSKAYEQGNEKVKRTDPNTDAEEPTQRPADYSSDAEQVLQALFEANYDFLLPSKYDFKPHVHNITTLELMLTLRIEHKYLTQVLDYIK